MLSSVAGHGGVVWSASPSGCHANLVVLEPGGSIGTHRNDELDVLVVVLDGHGTITIDGAAVPASATTAVVVPAGAVRSVTAGPGGLRYLTIHAERRPLAITASRGGRDV